MSRCRQGYGSDADVVRRQDESPADEAGLSTETRRACAPENEQTRRRLYRRGRPTSRANSRSVSAARTLTSPYRRSETTISRACSSSGSASGPLSSSARRCRKLPGSNLPASTRAWSVSRLRGKATRSEQSHPKAVACPGNVPGRNIHAWRGGVRRPVGKKRVRYDSKSYRWHGVPLAPHVELNDPLHTQPQRWRSR